MARAPNREIIRGFVYSDVPRTSSGRSKKRTFVMRSSFTNRTAFTVGTAAVVAFAFFIVGGCSKTDDGPTNGDPTPLPPEAGKVDATPVEASVEDAAPDAEA